jgi:pimeloyl-ACP methyl ester carboxylesterase
VFAFHGLPGSRLQVHPDESIAHSAGARVIHVDRPGWGQSDACPGRRIGDWPADIRRLADHLKVDRFAVAGVSGGGPFAAACATKLGDRLTRTAIISGVGPPHSMLSAKSWEVRTGFRAAASNMPWVIAPVIAAAALIGARVPGFFLDRLIARVPDCDRDILRRRAIRCMLMNDIAEAFRNGHQAFLDDLQLEARPWDIDFKQVSCPVALWHGDLDTIVPPGATVATAALLPKATVRIFPGAGHFFVFEAWREILDWLLADVAPIEP